MNLNLQLGKTHAAVITAVGVCATVQLFFSTYSRTKLNNIFNRFFTSGIKQNNEMNYQTALKILNVSSFANRSAIMKSYYHLMKKNHPDAGGKLTKLQ